MKMEKGDITLLIVFMVVSIMSFMLIFLSQRVAVQIQRDRQGVASQQALQAANTGIEQWLYELKTEPPGTKPNTIEFKESLFQDNGMNIDYEVSYQDNPERIQAIGKVDSPHGDRVHRVLILEF